MASRSESRYFGLYFVFALQTPWSQSWMGLLFNSSVSSNSAYSVKAIDTRNNKKKNKMEKWHILQSIKNHEAYVVNLSNASK